MRESIAIVTYIMRYAIPMGILILLVPAFFTIAKGRFAQFGWAQKFLRVIAALPIAISACIHLARPEILIPMLPPVFPHPRALVIFSGICELAGALGLILPHFARTASVCICLLLIAIYPANIHAAHQTIGGLHMPGIPVRTAMQCIYMLLVLFAGWGIPARQPALKY
jgi:uncharacterized membrane protein